MPSQVNEEMVFVARDCQSILDICDKLAEVSARLLERDQTRLLDSPQLVSRISIKDRDSSLMAAGRLSDAPVIARIVCKDETNRTRIFYTTPVLAPPGVARANLSSIYSSFGRLTFLPLGGSIKTAKGETLTVIERALLRPRDYVKERDAFNTLFESHSRDPIRVKSLRATIAAFGERRKTPREPQDASSAVSLEAPLRPEALDVVVDEGEIRPLIEGLRLKAPLIVSSAQDEIGRFPLSARPVIIGPPGTGKTVSLIRRLDFRISREALEEDEPGYIDHLDKLGGPPHAASWRLFTPTRELKAYVKDAAESLAVPDFERNCACWEDERLALASYLGLLDSLIAVPDGEGLLSAAAKSDTAGWYKDFTAFHLDCFYRSLSAKAKRLAQDEDPAFSSLGAALLDIVAKSASKPLSWFRECLGLRQDELAELLKERNSLFNQELKSLFNDLAARDPSLPGALVTLQTSASSQAPIEGARLRIAALRLYREAAADKALAVFRGRPLPAESLSAKAAAFLGDGRLPSQSRLNELGADRQRAIALRRFKVDDKLFLDGYFEAIVPSYLRFKRSSRLWYDGPGYAPAKVEGLELDLLILSVLEPGSELAKAESREPGPSPRSR
ncbi:MAG: hypothetical protein LBE49_07040, partial [Deltaproteobacteria bacterium]|nr:hypothetical protein [Deltaproteobacteria bacterium]